MKQILTLFLLLVTIGLWAQAPVNDDCTGVIDLGVAPYCDETEFFTNVDATPTDIGNDNVPGNPDCAGLGIMERDVWFSFVASDTIDDYQITVTGITDGMGSTPMLQPQLAVYRGDCEFDGLELLECNAAEMGESSVEICLAGLDAGLTYYLRVTDYSATAMPNAGTFQLCIIKKPPVVNLCDNTVSNLCSGTVFDCGGPDGDYGSNENFTFTITPPPPVECITFTLEYYNIDEFSDAITFYDGPDTNSPIISSVTGNNFSDGGGGAVCYQVTASSGSLTLQFTSDGSLEFEGFAGSWECSSVACDPTEIITVDPDVSDLDIIDAISTPLTTVTITDINCATDAYGTFEAGDFTDLGLEKGLILSSGSVAGAANPGNVFSSLGTGFPGDPDLDVISTGFTTNDACVLELDVFAATDQLSFEYVFGSEEYPEFVNSSFNDIFAFLVSGPGIVGDPGLGGQKNIAVLPAPGTGPVEIDNVNNLVNWEFYRNNLDGPSVVYDGLTADYLGVKKSLTAETTVTPCETYHLKLAIADRGDTAYDSGVFISELQGGTVVTDVVYNNGIDYLVEECIDTPDEVVISLSSPPDEDITYDVLITGTATPGVDYTLNIPGQITFTPTENVFTFPIESLADGIPEGVETIEITLTNDFGCGTVMFETLTIEIYDQLNVEIDAGADTAYVCQGSNIQLEATGAIDYVWAPQPVFDDPFIADPIATPAISQDVFVVGSLGVCTAIDTIHLQVVDPIVNIGTSDPTGICVGDSVTLGAMNNVGGSGLIWTASPPGSIDDPTVSPITVSPTVTTTYTVNVELEGCGATDEITIEVDPFDFPAITTTDTTICQNYSVDLGSDIVGSSTTFMWSPATGLDPGADVSGPVATPDETTTYTLIATSQNAFCADTTDVTIEVIPANVEIIDPTVDSLEICLGESVDLTALTSTPGTGLEWTPDNGTLSSTTEENTVATPTESTLYTATLTVGACMVFDSIYIRVDSLPEGEVSELIPDKETYCEGELITIVSPTYEPANFPDIEHMWIPDIGQQTPDSLWNLVIQAVETTTYYRITTNRGCIDTAEVFIEVVPTAAITIDPPMATICDGESIQLTVLSDDEIESYSWDNAGTLSCDDCPDPVATPSGTTTYSVEGEFEGCPVNASTTITVETLPAFEFPDDTEICPGESILLYLLAEDPDITYTWTVDGDVVSNDAQYEVSPGETTTYTLTMENNGCVKEEDITVTVITEVPTLSVSPDTLICIGESANLSATGSFPGNFTWEPTGGEGDMITVTPTGTTTYTVTYESGCYTLVDSVSVQVASNFVITDITAEPDPAFEGTDVLLEAFTNPPVLSNPTYIWTYDNEEVGTGNPVTVQAPQIEDPEVDSIPASYYVLITDDIGCVQGAEVSFTVLASNYLIPNVFTPNGDGTNDVFNVLSKGNVEVLDFKIYNRWGQLIYDNDTNDIGWTGIHNGKPAPSDVYAYKILVRKPDGSEEIESGEVTLVR